MGSQRVRHDLATEKQQQRKVVSRVDLCPEEYSWICYLAFHSKTWSVSQNKEAHFRFGQLFLQFSSVQLLSRVQLVVTPWTAACQASLSITNSRSLLKIMSIESVMPSNHLMLCCPLLFPLSIFPSIRVFANRSVLRIRPNYWSFSFSISPSNE